MKEKLAKLIDVKSIVTMSLVITLVIVILCKLQIADNVFQLFSSAVMLVLGFFFGKRSTKDGDQ
jgi:uncharacterized membrane protein YjjP (DUF1212 family)